MKLNTIHSNSFYLDTISSLISKNNKNQLWIKDNLLCLFKSGSTLYGTNHAKSDEDLRGVFLSPKEFWVGCHYIEQLELRPESKDIEFVAWDFKKFLKLVNDCSPNIIELLYIEKDNPNVLYWTEEWSKIREEAKKLVSNKVYLTFYGYSQSQMKKMVTKQSNKTGRRFISDEMGFDMKFVAHAFRLIDQSNELLKTGKMTFPRKNADYLKQIRNGEIYKLDEIDKCLSDWEKQQMILSEMIKESVLPKGTDFDLYNKILIDVFDQIINREDNVESKRNIKIHHKEVELA